MTVSTVRKLILLLLPVFFIALAALFTAENSYAEIASGVIDDRVQWTIADSGTLTVEPVSEYKDNGARISTEYGFDEQTGFNNPWPWNDYNYDIKKVVMKGKIKYWPKYSSDPAARGYRSGARRMFAYYPYLEEVDTSGLEVFTYKNDSGTVTMEDQSFFSEMSDFSEMFWNCPKLKKVDLSGVTNNGRVTKFNRMFRDSTEIREIIWNNPKFVSGGFMSNEMFASDDEDQRRKYKLEKVDMSNITIKGRDTFSIQPPVPGSAESGFNTYDGYKDFARLFYRMENLKAIHMNNTKLPGINNFSYMLAHCVRLGESFTNLDGQTEEGGVFMDGIELKDATDMRSMFFNCNSLKKLDISSFGKLPRILNVNGMLNFGYSPVIEELVIDNLDISNIGPYSSRHYVDGSIGALNDYQIYYEQGNEGDGYTYDYYNYVNRYVFDWTKVYPYASNPANSYYATGNDSLLEPLERVTKEESMKTGAIEYGRYLFGNNTHNDIQSWINPDTHVVDTFGAQWIFDNSYINNLKTLSAKNSKVWASVRNKGIAGKEYYDASDPASILWISHTSKVKFTPDGGSDFVISSKRDWVDMVTDRESSNVATFDGDMPDLKTNPNILYDLNKSGAGFFPPGVYTKLNEVMRDQDITMPASTYGIINTQGVRNVKFTVEYDSSHPELDYATEPASSWSCGYFAVGTKPRDDWKSMGNEYVIDLTDNPIKVTYQNAAIDEEGNKKDLIVTLKKITFKDLDKLPEDPGRKHDKNNYVTDGTEYYRPVLKVNSYGIHFTNYIIKGKISDNEWTMGMEDINWAEKALLGGAGTDIDYSIEVAGAKEGDTFIFHGRDIDVATSQSWEKPKSDDACFDYLPIENNTYAEGGEGFVLDPDTVKTKRVKFAEHTGLMQKGNRIMGTGTDPNTAWSSFAVPASAKGANLTWTSTLTCTTHALLDTGKPRSNLVIEKETVDDDPGEFDYKVNLTRPKTADDVKTYEFVLDEQEVRDNRFSMPYAEIKPLIDDGYIFSGYVESRENLPLRHIMEYKIGDTADNGVFIDFDNIYNGEVYIKVPSQAYGKKLHLRFENHVETGEYIPVTDEIEGLTKVDDNGNYTATVKNGEHKIYNLGVHWKAKVEEVSKTGWELVSSKETVEGGEHHIHFVNKLKVSEVKYSYSGNLPSEVLETLPENGSAKYGTNVTPENPSKTSVAVTGGTWVFKGWNKASQTVEGEDVEFVGTWEFTEDKPEDEPKVDPDKPKVDPEEPDKPKVDPDVPDEPDEPEEPKDKADGGNKKPTPNNDGTVIKTNTGDETPVALWIALVVTAVLALIAIVAIRKKKN